MLEMLIVVAVTIILSAIAIPGYINIAQYLRVAGDLRSLNGITAQAKMRAAADFTHARAYADLSNNTFHLEVWNKAGDTSHTSGCWQTDGATTACTQTTGVTSLSQGDTWGYGTTVTAGPTAATASIAQSPACTSGVAGASSGSTITNTACIEFNSRGVPVDSTNKVVGNNAIYLTNGKAVDGVTVSATGFIQTWSTSASGTGSSWSNQ